MQTNMWKTGFRLACATFILTLVSATQENTPSNAYTERLLSLEKYTHESQHNYSHIEDLLQVLEGRSLISLYDEVLSDAGNISGNCHSHLNLTLEAVFGGQPWALAMLDAAGKLPAGVINGDILWMGNFDECVNITATIYKGPNETEPTHPFKGRYCKAGIPLKKVGKNPGVESPTIPPGYAQLGLCVPSSCSASDVKVMIKSLLNILNRTAHISIEYPVTVCHKEHLDIDSRAAFAYTFLGILAALIIVGTAYDIFAIHKLHVSAEVEEEDTSGDEAAPLIPGQGSPDIHSNNLNIRYRGYGTGDVGDRLMSPISKNIQEQPESGRFMKIMQAFSVYTNASKLLSTNTQAGNLEPVNGIRFISLSWVILGHSYAFILYDAKNVYPFLLKKLETFSAMVLINATFAVDTFFLLSGLLVGYLTLKEFQKVGGVKKFRWVMFYFHRFWRLTPPYGLVMLLYIPLLKYWSDGPFWPQDGVENNYCKDTWYKSLLYVNNFFSASNTCMVWGWYLANDMQFYIISPLFLIPLYKSGVLGTLVCMLVLVGSWVAGGAISSINDLPIGLFGGKNSVAGGNTLGYFDELYVKPYTRIGPYIIGLLVGYVLYKTECKSRLTRVQNLLGWLVATVCCMSTVYGNFGQISGKVQNLLGWLVATVCCMSTVYGNFGQISGKVESSKHVIALYNAVARSVWAMGVAWVIYACATRHGGIVNRFLSWKLFVPLSRLTYLAYLIHPVVIEVYYLSKREGTYITDLEVAYFFVGHLVISYAVAFVLSLCFEAPFMGLEKALFRRERKH